MGADPGFGQGGRILWGPNFNFGHLLYRRKVGGASYTKLRAQILFFVSGEGCLVGLPHRPLDDPGVCFQSEGPNPSLASRLSFGLGFHTGAVSVRKVDVDVKF